VIIEKAGFGVDGSGDADFKTEAVAVQAPAFVPFREGGQMLGSLKIKFST
jgi:hypothetical protein